MFRLQTFHARLSATLAERERNPRPAHGQPAQLLHVCEVDGRCARGAGGGDVLGLLSRVHRELCAVAENPVAARGGEAGAVSYFEGSVGCSLINSTNSTDNNATPANVPKM